MQNARIFRIILSYVLFLFILIACSSSRLSIPVTRPAEINLKGFDKIAIGEIDGRGSRQLTDELTLALFKSKRFEVLDRQHLDAILKEHSLSLSGLVDESTAVEVGKLIGTAALIFGNITEYDYSEELTHRDETNKKTKKTIRKWQRKGTSKVTATLQVVDLATGKIIAISKLEKAQSATKYSDVKRPAKVDKNALFSQCRENIVRKFMREIAPYTERVSVAFETDDKMPELQQGYNMAKIGNWDEAIISFQTAVKKYKNGQLKVDKAYYNLGLGYMYTDRFTEARQNFELAYKRKAEGKYEQAIKKLNRRIEEKRRLKEQM
ncbi:MAG: hypothetical protein DWQ05_08640 [Calditrichaeota bacterium]|nr:MAG: hypothetical protein DWQ05_08640 [Calditrichota bacterium]